GSSTAARGADGAPPPIATEGASGGTMPLKIIDEHLMVRCDLLHEGYRATVHLLVEFDNPDTFDLWGFTVKVLHADGPGALVDAQFPGFALHGLTPKGPGSGRSNL